MASLPSITIPVDSSAVDTLIAKLEETRALLLEIDALLHEDADGANPPPPRTTPA